MPGPRVLILEDEPLIAMLAQDWLDELGYEAIGPAHSLSQAFSLIESEKPEAAILDVSIGSADSFSVADELKALNVPFAFATGRYEREIVKHHADVPILEKPYDVDAVKLVLHKLLPHAGRSPE